jgi:uncharacterized membrane protein YfcA
VTLAALVLAVAVAAAVQVVTGFGFALVAAPVLVAVTDPVTSVSILALLGALVSACLLTTSREPLEILGRTSARLLLWAVPALVAGALVVSRLPADVIRAAVGVLVIAALVQRGAPARTPARPVERATPRRRDGLGLAAAGLASGTMTTSTGLNGPPLVLYLTAQNVSPRATRDTLALLFLILDVAAVVALEAVHHFTLPTETLALPVAGLAGVLLGHRIFDRLGDRTRMRAVTAMLVVSACIALGAAVI